MLRGLDDEPSAQCMIVRTTLVMGYPDVAQIKL